jgi:hypothetical protein
MIESKRILFSESALARELGTTRWAVANSDLEPISRAGMTKIYAMSSQQLDQARKTFTSSMRGVCETYTKGDKATQLRMMANPRTADMLKNHLRPKLVAENSSK